jgi:hypothetical protein
MFVMPKDEDTNSSDHRQSGYPASRWYTTKCPNVDFQTLQEKTADTVMDDIHKENIAISQAGTKFAACNHQYREAEQVPQGFIEKQRVEMAE